MNVLEQWAQEADLEQWAHEANAEQVRSETQPVPQSPSAWDTAFAGSKYVPYFGLLGLSQWVLPPETFEKPVAEIPQGVANVIGESMFGLAPRIAKAVLPKEYAQAIPEVAGEAVKGVAEAALTPKYAPLTALSLVPGGAELAAPIFAGMGLEALPESIRALVQAETPKERVGAAVQTGLNVGMAAAPVLLRGGRAGGRVEPSSTVETGAPGIPGAPRMIEGPVIDIAPAPLALPPGGRPILPPMGRQFDVTPMGVARDVSKLSADDLEAFRRASAFAGRQPVPDYTIEPAQPTLPYTTRKVLPPIGRQFDVTPRGVVKDIAPLSVEQLDEFRRASAFAGRPTIPARKPIIVRPPSIQPEPAPAPHAAEVPAELPAEKPLTTPEPSATETGVKTTVRLTKNDAEEVWHKMDIVSNEPDLLADYGLTKEQANALVDSIPKNGVTP